jgi:hypothetical protein
VQVVQQELSNQKIGNIQNLSSHFSSKYLLNSIYFDKLRGHLIGLDSLFQKTPITPKKRTV